MSEDPCLKVDEKVTTLKSGNGLLTLIKSEAAQVITKYFSSVLVQGEDNSTFARAHNPRYAISDDDITQHIQFTTSAVLEKLQQLHIDKSPGPDGNHPSILHHCASAKAEPLSVIFHKSYDERSCHQIGR
jgi:hypothetical protein